MFKSKINNKTNSFASAQPLTPKNGPGSTFSDDAIRTRAYQIYESRDGTGNHADQDWYQAEVESMELV